MNCLKTCICSFLLLFMVLIMAFPINAAESLAPDKTALVAVIPADFPPTYFRDKNGEPAGLAVDVMDAIAQRAGLTVTYRFANPWQEIEELVQQGSADLIPFRVMNDKTIREFLFTTELDTLYINYIVRADDKLRKGAQLDSKIGVIRGSTAYEYLKKNRYQQLAVYDSLEHLLIDLLSGQTDLTLTATKNLQQMAEQLGLEERIRVLEPAELETRRGIAVRHGNEQLRDRLNKAIKAFHNDPASIGIYEKWLGKPKPYWTAKRTGIALGSLLVLTVVLLITWHNRTLRRSNRTLAAEQAFLQTMIDAIPDFIFFKDRSSVYLGCNQAFAEQVHGCPRAELLGLNDYDLHQNKELAEQFQRTDREVIQSGQAMKFDVAVPLKDGKVIRAESIKVPFRNETGEVIGLIGIARDITERFQHLQQLEQARERAEAANQAKSQFLANMSHEIRTPLNGVLGMAQLLAFSNLDQEQREQLGMIQASGGNLLNILNDILDLAKIEADMLTLVPKLFSPAELLNESISFFRYPCKNKGIELVLEQGQGLPPAVQGDPQRIKQILFNLLGNAVKFTPAGRVSLGCDVVAIHEDRIRLCFCVQDTGIGISAADQERIFSPFEQVDNSNTREYGGTGLGLSICQRLTQLMGGSLTLDSTVGHGSCFRLTLDVRLETEAAPASGECLSADPLANVDRLTVLVAEDNEINRFFMVRLLQQLGHQVLEAADGRQAVDLLQQHDCDLVLMDIQMPVLDGVEALQMIRQRDAARKRYTPVIALTAYAMSGDRERFLCRGFDDYLAKPLQPGDLEAAVAEFVKTRSLL